MIYEAMPDAEYHARPELSSSGVRLLLDSPARFRHWADNPQPARAVFDLGSAAHTKILGVGERISVYPPEHLTPSGNASTKAATVEWEDTQRAEGLIPVTPRDAQRVDEMAEAVLADSDARAVLERIGGREVSVITDVHGVPSRARFDMYDGVQAADLKTTRDASPSGFNTSVGRYGYHIQERWYTDAHKAETGTDLQRFTFVVVESTAPFLVGVYDLDWLWAEIAEKRVKHARDLWLRCTETGIWPGYGTSTLTPPTWAIYENEEEEVKI